MSRDARRAAWRRTKRRLTDAGCTCVPTLVPSLLGPPEFQGWIRHRRGCVLGDKVAELNATGVYPPVIAFKRRCDR